MAGIEQSHVEVYVFRRRARLVEFLCLRRSASITLPGVWQPITGRRRRGERAVAAAMREMLEETGLRPRRLWALETMTTYFDPSTDRVRMLPLFAAEIGNADRVQLSREHDTFRFLAAAAAGNRFLWEGQRRGLEAVRREVLEHPRLAKALEIELKTTRAKRG